MGLFRPYERKDGADTRDQIATLTPKGQKAAAKAAAKDANEAAPVVEDAPEESTKIQVTRTKANATRSRRQAEADRMERLHPTLTPKEQRKAASRAREDARVQALDKQERSPQRQLARDYVDTRWTINEFMLPIFILLMAASMATMSNITLSSYILMGMWVVIGMVVINTFLLWRGYKKLLAERHPSASPKGLLFYLFNRSIMIRRFRQPGPRIKRGDPI
ncbi:hypothetical protein BW730_08340 [Tessaracoccus aquimaris]|uniref:DUF3043 domain-containing protein n=1 Tax=Tessaracoccus aquimaris TaxID=1332264 RepID=A0A1Q2CN67_9ACTN|nr:DUF3043 domain-containing protein [Tessaracoccus aquimaris]AQP47500.1 hypothetical protein BW730_08340 [Tessaracoccus aquimaris]